METEKSLAMIYTLFQQSLESRIALYPTAMSANFGFGARLR
jgi:hypothetical protein